MPVGVSKAVHQRDDSLVRYPAGEPIEAPRILALDFQSGALRLLGDFRGPTNRVPGDDQLSDRLWVATELLENRVHTREPLAGVRFLPTHPEVTLARRWGESSTATSSWRFSCRFFSASPCSPSCC